MFIIIKTIAICNKTCRCLIVLFVLKYNKIKLKNENIDFCKISCTYVYIFSSFFKITNRMLQLSVVF